MLHVQCCCQNHLATLFDIVLTLWVAYTANFLWQFLYRFIRCVDECFCCDASDRYLTHSTRKRSVSLFFALAHTHTRSFCSIWLWYALWVQRLHYGTVIYRCPLYMISPQKGYVFFTIQDRVVFCSIEFVSQYNGGEIDVQRRECGPILPWTLLKNSWAPLTGC